MSSYYFKTKYKEMGNYGSVDEHIIYCHHNNSCDIVSYYNEKGECLLSVEDTLHDNILDAFNKLMWAWENTRENKLVDGIEYMTPKEIHEIIWKGTE